VPISSANANRPPRPARSQATTRTGPDRPGALATVSPATTVLPRRRQRAAGQPRRPACRGRHLWSLAALPGCLGVTADSLKQVVQALDELPGGGVSGELLAEAAGVLAVGGPAGSRGFERGEPDRVGVQGSVGALGRFLADSGSPEHAHHRVHAVD